MLFDLSYPPIEAVATFASILTIGGLLAGPALGQLAHGIGFAIALLSVGLVARIIQLLVSLPFGRYSATESWADWIAWAIVCLLVGRFIIGVSHQVTRARRIGSLAVALLFASAAMQWPKINDLILWQSFKEQAADDRFEIDAERLWTAQPELVEGAIAKFEGLPKRTARTFTITIAASGSQQIFGREALRMRELLEKRFDVKGFGVTLSNGRAHLGQMPMANRTNLTSVLGAVAETYDAKRDLLVIYLTSHGSSSAALETLLPDYTDLQPISASFLAQELKRLGLNRRFIIVSACYSGSWVAPLASADTIMMTASAADRVSFGCDDSRQFTVYGDALSRGLERKESSLRAISAEVAARVAEQEVQSAAKASSPQVSIGSNMRSLWLSGD